MVLPARSRWGQRGRGALHNGAVTGFPPMRLDQRSIDLLGIDDAELLAHGLDQTAQAEIARAA